MEKNTGLRGDQDSISVLKVNSSMTLPTSMAVLFFSECWQTNKQAGGSL